jgi:hypothetical protein
VGYVAPELASISKSLAAVGSGGRQARYIQSSKRRILDAQVQNPKRCGIKRLQMKVFGLDIAESYNW